MEVPELIGQILFLSASVVVGLLINRLIRLDVTLSCLAAGVLAGLSLPWLGLDTGIRASNIQDLVFYVILPVLIFDAAWHIKPGVLKRWLTPILLLSTVGMIVSTLVVATILYYAIGSPQGFPWIAALLAGAILAATDPIAVVSSLKRFNAPEDLTTLVEGESLFNDASALVLFAAILGFAVSSETQLDQNYLGLFALTFFGGLALGAVLGLGAATLVLLLANSAGSNIILIFSAFSSFYIAEHFFHVSGIMSLVATAMVLRTLLKEHEQQFLGGVVVTWEWLGAFFNALIFVLMGLVITFEMFTDQWLAIAIAIPAALIGRALAVFSCGAVTRPLPRPVPMGWQYILVWGGLRGAIAVVLVLSLPVSLPYWWTVQSMVFGVVLLSLLVQGTTTGGLIRKHRGNAD
ncbi:MAG: cation:proton antiporter [Gammaproteobacteria bacterium]|nr:cation:proton antiporter [Gammaproteobacteria bacterium]